MVDEDIDFHVFTGKRRFSAAMKVQERQYENIPLLEKSREQRFQATQKTNG